MTRGRSLWTDDKAERKITKKRGNAEKKKGEEGEKRGRLGKLGRNRDGACKQVLVEARPAIGRDRGSGQRASIPNTKEYSHCPK